MTPPPFVDLRTCARNAPLEVDDSRPLLSWKCGSEASCAAGSRSRVQLEQLDAHGAVVDAVWSTEVPSDVLSVRIPEGALRPRTSYRWWIAPIGAPEQRAFARFETGMRDRPWSAKWIARNEMRRADDAGEPLDPADTGDLPRSWAAMYSLPPSQFRRQFALGSRTPVRARLHISAHGIYRAWINGVRIGNDELAPGWTRYETRIDYQVHDVTALLEPGDNVLGATVGDGWWSGRVGYDTRRQAKLYGVAPELIAELHVEFADGSIVSIETDHRWRAGAGEIVMSDLLMGEYHDPRIATAGWHLPEFDDSSWTPVEVRDAPTSVLRGQQSDPIRVVEEVPARAQHRAGTATVFDFGQNLTGRVRLRIRGASAGDIIELRHGEALSGERVYTDNLRSAEARDVVVATGDPVQVFEPLFTLHGFRYLEVDGLRTPAHLTDVHAQVLASDLPRVGGFSSGNSLLEQLQSNIFWSLRGNYVGLPTDCPQRDERLGWTADTQIFARTASFNVDTRAFLTSWLSDLFASQTPDGCVPDVAPVPPGSSNFDVGAPGWGDAAVVVPWVLYEEYGDLSLLAEHYPHMRAWVQWVERNNPDSLWTRMLGNNYGDWLSVDEHTPHGLVAAAYQIRSLDLVVRAASELGFEDDAALFSARAAHRRSLYAEEFIAGGTVKGDTQSGYLFTLAWDLAPPENRRALGDRLVRKIEGRGRRLTSGFLGVNLIGPVLTRIGRSDLALALVLQRDYPSWGYSIDRGATTIWERWDAYTEHAGFQDVRMNSFNHYSLGSVGEWIYRVIGGIDQEPGSRAYRSLRVEPLVREELSPVHAWHESPRGRIAVEWEVVDGRGSATLTIPPGSTAVIRLPGLERHVGAGTHTFDFDPSHPQGEPHCLRANDPGGDATKTLPEWSSRPSSFDTTSACGDLARNS
ncbi:family 78 glycoside hydrolase catalytic domain [Microbacterium aquimaris]|uniref:alpha-L-rhamnosidase n=1 Tax=Microbacterium aquimaris TaxID=459816 RepID=UPI002AD3EDA6|nr:family 78 glycoside hydrolase catalytic domain [Microbacterium aquimaris]MDZ8275744.1 family 78 glycoside hydrolase catalytic domain [Microbacterium aquimaris]